MRRAASPLLWTILLATPGLAFAADFDCQFSVENNKYDLRDLAGEHSATHEWDTPPSKTVDRFRWNLCADLNKQEDVADVDQVRSQATATECTVLMPISGQCGSGTRVCLTRTNRKDDEKDRIVAAIQVARTQDLAPEYSELKSALAPTDSHLLVVN